MCHPNTNETINVKIKNSINGVDKSGNKFDQPNVYNIREKL